MGKGLLPVSKSRQSIKCKLCPTVVKYGNNFRKHLKTKHLNFIKIRISKEGINFEESIVRTHNDHRDGGSIPQLLMDYYNKTKVTSFFKKNVNLDSGNVQSACVSSPSSHSNLGSECAFNINAPLLVGASFADVESILFSHANVIMESQNLNIEDPDDPCKDYLSESEAANIISNDHIIPMRTDSQEANGKSPEGLHQGSLSSSESVLPDNQPETVSQTLTRPPVREVSKQCRFGSCGSCNSMKYSGEAINACVRALEQYKKECFDTARTEQCFCIAPDCCCSKLYEKEIKNDAYNSPAAKKHVEDRVVKDMNTEYNFYIDNHSGRYFCQVCCRHSSKNIHNQKGTNDWTTKGYEFKLPWKKLLYMRNHLNSHMHMESLKLKALAEKDKPMHISSDMASKTTKNLCVAAQLFCDQNYSHRSFPYFCAFMDMCGRRVCEDQEKFVHLLGNRSNTKNSIGQAKIACFKSVLETLSSKFKTDSPITKSAPKLMLSADMGHETYDVLRQVIVGTFINEKGILQEKLLTAAEITNHSAILAAEHLKKHLEDLVVLDNVVVVSTDGDSCYTGRHGGMFALLKQKHVLKERTLYLPDFCHKAERLLARKSEWISETLANSGAVVRILRQNSLSEQLFNFAANSDGNFKFFTPLKISETRWAEFTHAHLNSILQNVDICLHCLPTVIELPGDFDRQKTENVARVLRYMSDPFFIARLLMIDMIYVQVAVAQKQAQHVSFGPFKYLTLVKTLKQTIKSFLDYDFSAIEGILSGDFEYSFMYNSKSHTHKVNLNEVDISQVGLNLRRSSKSNSLTSLKNEFRSYVTSLIESYDSFFEIDQEVELAYQIFGSLTLDITDLTIKFRELFSKLNVCFYYCTHQCLGIKKCVCVREQLKRFLDHFKKDGSRELNFYLSIDNAAEVNKLQIVNIVRVIEIVLLMKASQAGTERVISVIRDIVERYYRGTYTRRETKGDDMVNVTVFLKRNSSIFTLDAELARTKFIEDGHMDTLMSSMPPFTMGKAVKTVYQQALGDEVKSGRKHSLVACIESIRPRLARIEPDTQDDECLNFESEIMDLEMINQADNTPDMESCQSNGEIFCFCGDNDKEDTFVGCDNMEGCSSFLKRLNMGNSQIKGGDWFHISCLGLSEVPSKREKWICYPCHSHSIKGRHKSCTPFELLKLDLGYENWKIGSIRPDGNCMFSVFSVHMYGTPNRHIDARRAIMDKTEEIFSMRKFRGDWSVDNNCPSVSSKDILDKFVFRIIHYFKDSILGDNCDRPITEEDRVMYLSKKYEPASSGDLPNITLEKYGGPIEMEVFSILMKKNLWTLRTVQHEGGVAVRFRWIPAVIYNLPLNEDADEALLKQDYACFFYEMRGSTDGAHYSSIMIKSNDKARIHPKVDKCYPLIYEMTKTP